MNNFQTGITAFQLKRFASKSALLIYSTMSLLFAVTCMMVLASIYLYVSGSLPTTSAIKPVEIWLIFNLIYPCFIILSNVLLQVNSQCTVIVIIVTLCRFLINQLRRGKPARRAQNYSCLTKNLRSREN